MTESHEVEGPRSTDKSEEFGRSEMN